MGLAGVNRGGDFMKVDKPHVKRYGDYIAIMWRSRHGWVYGIGHLEYLEWGFLPIIGPGWSFMECKRQAVADLKRRVEEEGCNEKGRRTDRWDLSGGSQGRCSSSPD